MAVDCQYIERAQQQYLDTGIFADDGDHQRVDDGWPFFARAGVVPASARSLTSVP